MKSYFGNDESVAARFLPVDCPELDALVDEDVDPRVEQVMRDAVLRGIALRSTRV